LLIGPTVLERPLAHTLAKMLDVPSHCGRDDLTSGYVARMWRISSSSSASRDGDVTRRSRHYLHRRDRQIGRKMRILHHPRREREGVQQALLKILEGTCQRAAQGGASTPTGVHRRHTTNILFICGERLWAGARGRPAIARSTGLQVIDAEADAATTVRIATPNCCARPSRDLIKYGLIPEFVGRLP